MIVECFQGEVRINRILSAGFAAARDWDTVPDHRAR
ncbi:hypothetical protein N185_25875 [Sinorhizobium sp. GW3]|nr:hypothetical protein N185_25875 [Sinorhizobium sp. GW3]